jgi:hypothetical protein
MRTPVRPVHPSAEPCRALQPDGGDGWVFATRGPGAGDAPRGLRAVWAFCRAPSVQGSPERANLGDGPPAGLGS